jgi:hypothetical protein
MEPEQVNITIVVGSVFLCNLRLDNIRKLEVETVL